MGVQLFFVLSGFLITRILLKFRDHRVDGGMKVGDILLSFHSSRIARIWPIYFLTLSAVFLAGNRFELRQNMIWHSMFASNLLFFEHGEFGSVLSHFWSLAVEQQFYLAWPIVILLVPERYLERVTMGLILVAPATRLALYFAGLVHFAQYNVLPFANFDSLGLGALVAMWSRLPQPAADTRWKALAVLAATAVLGLVVVRLIGGLPANLEQSLYALAFAWIIAGARDGFPGVIGRALEWRPLVWLGVVSYGVYVYHMFAPRIAGALLRALETPTQFQYGLPLFLTSAVLTLLGASASWALIEGPILDWRRGDHTRASLRARLPYGPEAG